MATESFDGKPKKQLEVNEKFITRAKIRLQLLLAPLCFALAFYLFINFISGWNPILVLFLLIILPCVSPFILLEILENVKIKKLRKIIAASNTSLKEINEKLIIISGDIKQYLILKTGKTLYFPPWMNIQDPEDENHVATLTCNKTNQQLRITQSGAVSPECKYIFFNKADAKDYLESEKAKLFKEKNQIKSDTEKLVKKKHLIYK